MGKESVANALARKRSLNLKKVVTATTRAKRPYEVEGKHFYFFTSEEFQRRIKKGFFLEWAVHSGNRYYGTPIREVRRALQEKKHILLNIDVQGATQVVKKCPDAVRIFIKPDSVGALRRRMEQAGFTRDQIAARLQDAKRELHAARDYDYVVVNREGELRQAIARVAAIIKKEISE